MYTLTLVAAHQSYVTRYATLADLAAYISDTLDGDLAIDVVRDLLTIGSAVLQYGDAFVLATRLPH